MTKSEYNEQEFKTYLLNLGHSESTTINYAKDVKRYVVIEQYPENYTYQNVVDFLDELKKQDLSPRTISCYLNSIKKYYNYLIEKGVRDTHPCRNLYIKAKQNRDVIHHELFTMDELEKLMERKETYPELRTRNQVIISLMIYQGLVISEIEKLKFYHIDLDAGLINVPASRSLTRRSLAFNRKQFNLFYTYINETRPKDQKKPISEFIINKNGNGVKRQDINKMIRSMNDLFPFKHLNPTNIRKSVISYWLNSLKLPLEQVQLMSGHKWITSTEKYRYRNIDEERDMINRWFPNC